MPQIVLQMYLCFGVARTCQECSRIQVNTCDILSMWYIILDIRICRQGSGALDTQHWLAIHSCSMIWRGGGTFDKVVEIFDAFDDVQNPWPFFTFLHDNNLDNFWVQHETFCFKIYHIAIVLSVVKRILWMGLALLQTFSPLTSHGFFSSSMRCLLFSSEVGKKIPALRIFPPFHPSPVTSEGVEGKYHPFFFCTILFNC